MTTTTTPPCPECGAPITIDPHAETATMVFCPHPGAMPTLERRRRPAVVAFCTGCEFAIELQTGGRR